MSYKSCRQSCAGGLNHSTPLYGLREGVAAGDSIRCILDLAVIALQMFDKVCFPARVEESRMTMEQEHAAARLQFEQLENQLATVQAMAEAAQERSHALEAETAVLR